MLESSSRSIAYACLNKRVAESCPSGPCLLEQWMTTRFVKLARTKCSLRGPPQPHKSVVSDEGDLHAQARASFVLCRHCPGCFCAYFLDGFKSHRHRTDFVSRPRQRACLSESNGRRRGCGGDSCL